MAFEDIMCSEMGGIGIRCFTEAALPAFFCTNDRAVGHAEVYRLMLSHMSLVSITCIDCLGMFTDITPVPMATAPGRR